MKRIIEVNLILSAWLILAPFVLVHSTGPVVGMPTDVVLGAMLLVGSMAMLVQPPGHLGLAVYEAACGVCAMVTPSVLHGQMARDLAANSVIIGTLVLIASLTEVWILAHRPRRVD